MKLLISVSLGLAVLASAPAFAQIRTPYNSYPPTPAERAQTAELNRQAAEWGDWGADAYASGGYPRQAYSDAGYSSDDYAPRNYPRQGYQRQSNRYEYPQPQMGDYEQAYREGYRAGYSAGRRGQ